MLIKMTITSFVLTKPLNGSSYHWGYNYDAGICDWCTFVSGKFCIRSLVTAFEFLVTVYMLQIDTSDWRYYTSW